MRVVFIHNPASGSGGPSKDVILSILREAGHEPIYVTTDEADARIASGDLGELVVIAGGDGTVGKVAMSLARHRVPIAVLPLGTANNIATTLGASNDLRTQATGWARALPRPFDIGRVSGQGNQARFLESVGGGLFARAMASFDRKAQQGMREVGSPEEEVAAAIGELRNTLREASEREWRVELDGENHDGRYLLVEAMNIRRIGPNLNLAPAADFGDGLLDVVLLTEADRERFDDYLRRQMEGADAVPDVTVRRAAKVTLEPQGELVHVDDQLWPKPGNEQPVQGAIHLELESRALMFLVA